jgi:hypothetical protein
MHEVSRQLAGSLNVKRTVLRLLHLDVGLLGELREYPIGAAYLRDHGA